MPPDLANDQALTLKKRARRRLVGAIALVLLMVIVLPQVLQDRAALAPQAPIRIMMPESAGQPATIIDVPAPTAPAEPAVSAPVEAPVVEAPPPVAPVEPSIETLIAQKEAQAEQPHQKPTPSDVAPEKPALEKNAVEKPVTDKPAAEKPASEKPVAEKPTKETAKPEKPQPEPKKAEGNFALQVGVYSDAANVKRLQEQLKKAGFTTHTEKVKTAKGESIRLKAGSYHSRQEAVSALAKLKAAGLTGIIVNE